MKVKAIEITRNETGCFNVKIDMENGPRLYADRLNNEEALGETARCLFGARPHYSVSVETMIAREKLHAERKQ